MPFFARSSLTWSPRPAVRQGNRVGTKWMASHSDYRGLGSGQVYRSTVSHRKSDRLGARLKIFNSNYLESAPIHVAGTVNAPWTLIGNCLPSEQTPCISIVPVRATVRISHPPIAMRGMETPPVRRPPAARPFRPRQQARFPPGPAWGVDAELNAICA